MSWHQLDSRAYVFSKQVESFGPANTLALGAGEGLAIISPSPGMKEKDFSFVEKLGGAAAIVLPNSAHNLGVQEWRARFPRARVYAPMGALSKLVESGVRSLYPLDGMPSFENLTFRELPGTTIGGVIAISSHGKRPVVYSDELIVQLNSLPKATLPKVLFYLMRSAPGLNLNKGYLKLMVRQPEMLAESYWKILEENPVLVPAHGRILHGKKDLEEVKRLVAKLIPGKEVSKAS
jgi:hypothetical protein